MKPFEELTNQELATLEQEQIEKYLEIALMQEGVLRPVEPTPVLKPVFNPPISMTVFGVKQEGSWREPAMHFLNEADAVAVAQMPMALVESEYSAPTSTIKYGQHIVGASVIPVKVASEGDYKKAIADTKVAQSLFSDYQKAKEKFDQDMRGVDNIACHITDKISDARAEKHYAEEVCRTFAKYKQLANGDESIAMNFMKKPFTDERIETARQWFPDLVLPVESDDNF